MALLRDARDWQARFDLLFPHPTPEAAKRHREAFRYLERWLLRKKGNDHSVLADADHDSAASSDVRDGPRR